MGDEGAARSPGCRARVRSHALGWTLAVVFGCRPIADDDPRRSPEAGATAEAAPTPAMGPAVEVPPPTVAGLPDFARLAANVAPAVVTIVSRIDPRAEGPAGLRALRGLGSGMVVSATGQILTNEHVIAGATVVEVELADRRRFVAEPIHADPLLDLALLKLDQAPPGLTPVELSRAEPMPGQWVMAIGQPFSLGHTVTVGVVSGVARDHADLGRPPGLRSDGIWGFIQTDASINIGNSGGPLVGTDGRVLGMTTAVRQDGQGLAFAIPAPMLAHFLDEVWVHGRVRHPRLGLRAENAFDEVDGGTTVRITHVDAGTPAAEADIRAGDRIVAVDDRAVRRVSEIAYRAELAGVGARFHLTLERRGEPVRQAEVVLAELR